MDRRQELQEKYEEALFALLMEEFIEDEGKRLHEENERLNADPAAAIPAAAHRRCLRTIRRALARERRSSVKQVSFRVASKVALVAVVCMMLFVVAFAAFPGLRTETLNLLIRVSDVSTTLVLGDRGNYAPGSDKVYKEFGYYIPALPEGYVLVNEEYTGLLSKLCYENSTGSAITFTLRKNFGGELTVDTENANHVGSITVHGFDGLLIEKENRLYLVWGDTERSQLISIMGIGWNEEDLKTIADAMFT